jgi:hypothetical protein
MKKAPNLGEAAPGPGRRHQPLLGCWPEPAARECLIVSVLAALDGAQPPGAGRLLVELGRQRLPFELGEGCFTGRDGGGGVPGARASKYWGTTRAFAKAPCDRRPLHERCVQPVRAPRPSFSHPTKSC